MTGSHLVIFCVEPMIDACVRVRHTSTLVETSIDDSFTLPLFERRTIGGQNISGRGGLSEPEPRNDVHPPTTSNWTIQAGQLFPAYNVTGLGKSLPPQSTPGLVRIRPLVRVQYDIRLDL